jgi:hypothetical protein
MGDCILTLRSRAGTAITAGPLEGSQYVRLLCRLSDNYGGPGDGDMADVSVYGGHVYSATLRGRVNIADVDLAIQPQIPADHDPTNLRVRVVDASSGAEVAGGTNLSAETFILEVEMGT